MLITNTTDTIEILEGGSINLSLKKANIASIEQEPFIANTRPWESANPANAIACNVTVKINMNGGQSHVIDLKQVSNQTTWFSTAWTTPNQLQTGLVQAMSDLNSWL